MKNGRGSVLADITIGRYVARSSVVHALDPRTKTLAALAISISMLQGTTLPGTAWHLALAFGSVGLARLPWRFVVRSARPFAWLVGIVFATHLLVGGIGAWRTGLALAGRLLAMVTVASLLSWTTQPLSIVAGLRSLGSPLARIGLPVDAGATAVGLALRFAPIALSEAQTILRAQAARGADFRGMRRKLALVVPMLGALFERAFARAEVLAEAMESRGYSPEVRRTNYRALGWKTQDLVAAVVVLLWIACAIMVDRGIW